MVDIIVWVKARLKSIDIDAKRVVVAPIDGDDSDVVLGFNQEAIRFDDAADAESAEGAADD